MVETNLRIMENIIVGARLPPTVLIHGVAINGAMEIGKYTSF